MITVCKTSRDWRAFENAAEDLHRAEPAFCPPFPGSIAKFLKPDSAFHSRHGEIIPMLARRNGKVVGRIAAIINRTHNTYYKDKTGFFGFFDCEDDPATALALFAAAEAVLKERGMESSRGPYNPSINDECGLLVENNETTPYIGLPWNPAYYRNLVEGSGYQSVRELYGLDLPLHRLPPPPRLEKIVARIAKRSKIKLRPIKLDAIESEMEIIHEVYNNTLERNWGFVPIALDELLVAAEDMRQIADPSTILIAEMDGQNAGVALTLPNINELLLKTKRTPRLLRLLHAGLLIKTRRMTTCRQIVYGISPRFRDKGLHGWLLYEQFMCAKVRFHDAELGWVEESNTEILEHCQMLGATKHRTWKIYEKSLA